MRGYLAELDGRWGLDLTTTELVEAVVGAGVDWPRVERLGSLLVVADRVKFARRRPSHEQAARTLESARRWISGYEESPA